MTYSVEWACNINSVCSNWYKLGNDFIISCYRTLINPPTYTQIFTPTVVQGGWMEPVPGVFDMLQYFETILPSVESLWSSLHDEVYFMGCSVAGGLWRYQQLSPSRPPSWILPRIRNQVKTARNGDFLCLR